MNTDDVLEILAEDFGFKYYGKDSRGLNRSMETDRGSIHLMVFKGEFHITGFNMLPIDSRFRSKRISLEEKYVVDLTDPKSFENAKAVLDEIMFVIEKEHKKFER